MRLFLFAVGGTGSRILKPLVMQCAAGMCPIIDGKRNEDVEIVPIIMDPHATNENLKQTDHLLRWYRELRKEIYKNKSDGNGSQRGFFDIKISTLRDVVQNTNLNDTFLFNLGGMDSKKFGDFIDFKNMQPGDQALCSMLFSNDQLATTLGIGFVGSPNIGSVALNQFRDSEEYKQFTNVFRKEDKIFIISSIFGGTGAAGYPIIVKNIRNASNDNRTNGGDLSDSIIGALTVLPYFNISEDENSQVNASDFIQKTKSALEYYQRNITKDNEPSVNVCYYLGDEALSKAYDNDPGYNGQKNDAHIVEFIGALDVFHFLSLRDEDLSSSNGHADTCHKYEYGFKQAVDENKHIDFKDFGTANGVAVINEMISRMKKFHLLYLYLQYGLSENLSARFAKDAPSLDSSFLNSNFFTRLKDDFLGEYITWLKEMQNNHRSFTPFNLETAEPAKSITGYFKKKSFFSSSLGYREMTQLLNKASENKANSFNEGEAPGKLIKLFDMASDEMISDKYFSQA